MLPFGGNNKNSGDLSIYMHYKSAESADFFLSPMKPYPLDAGGIFSVIA